MYKKLITFALSTSILLSNSLFAGHDDHNECEYSLKSSTDFLIPQQHQSHFDQLMLDYEQQESLQSQSLNEPLPFGQMKDAEIESNYPQNNGSPFLFNTPAAFLSLPQYNFYDVTVDPTKEDILHKTLFTDRMNQQNNHPYSCDTLLSTPLLENFAKPSPTIKKIRKNKRIGRNFLTPQQHQYNFDQFMLDYEQQESLQSQSLNDPLPFGQMKDAEIEPAYPQNNGLPFLFSTPTAFLAVPQYNFHNVTFDSQTRTPEEDIIHKILFSDQMEQQNSQSDSFNPTLSTPLLNNFLKPTPTIKKVKKNKKLDIGLETHLKDVLLDRSALQGKLIQTQEQEYEDFCSKFSFSLTPCQENAIGDINQEFTSGKPMNRVLVGSVGFGKTEVAIRTAYKVAKSGHQVVILAPLRTLAEQHYKTFSERFKGTDINVAYLPSGYKSKKTLNDIASGKVQIIIGTHAVFSDAIKYKDIGYIIIDEEHKLGVQQKEKLRQHFTNAHVLWMSATLIPRTLELVNKGLMSSSHLTTPPSGRLAIVSNFMNFVEDEIRPIIDFELDRNGQVYIIVPKVSNIQETLNLIQQLYADRTVAMVHGEMSKKDISSNLEDFKAQKIDILVATTVIEVGIDVPNANTMIICDPKCFGMAQLSQLRGRVGRSPVQAYCYIGLNPADEIDNPNTLARLNAFIENSNLGDDMKLAELDLQFRGAGDLTSDRQKGQGGGWRNCSLFN